MTKRHQKITEARKTSLKNRLLFRVLTPPFALLLLLSIAGFWQLDSMARSAATDTLRRAAVATAAKLDREFALRQTVLRSTGTELFKIKSDYSSKRSALDNDRLACKTFVQKNPRFADAPGNVCRPFAVQLAISSQTGANFVKAIDIDYTTQVNDLNDQEQAAIRDRLNAFVEFFPETVALIVANQDGTPISQALSKQNDAKTTAAIAKIPAEALKNSVEGRYIESAQQRQLVFAYPIENGAVLAAYNLDHANFLRPAWQDTAIDRSKNYVVIANNTHSASYPKTDKPALYQKALTVDQSKENAATFSLGGVDYLSVAEPIGKSGWSVIVGSPSIIALDSLINAQIVAVIIIGLLLVSFLWVGSLFVNRTIRSILVLSGSALIFSSGDLAHRINPSLMDDEEFAHLATTLNSMAQRIQEAEKAVDQKNKEFISVATHEIKAPMTAIIGNLSMLLDDGMGQVDETARELATEAYHGTIRLRDLVNELLDIARLESGRATFNLETVDLAGEIRDMVKLQQVPARDNQITVTTELPGDLPAVTADKTKLEIILTNFISNAIKYNRPSGTVTISCNVEDAFVRIAITDTGLGIPEEQKAQMFQKFFRVEGDDRRTIPGTGLGMYITKQFIEAMSGDLWFESTHGKGTTFHFTLPIAAEPANDENIK